MNALLIGALALASQDTARWAPLAQTIEAAIADRAFPGAVVAVGRHDSVLYLQAFGQLTYAATAGSGARGIEKVTENTVYDIASLTKVVGLTTAMMMLVEEGQVELDAPASRYLTRLRDAPHAAITVRQLLTHSSGLPAWRPLFRQARSRGEMFALAAAEPLEAPPGSRMVYSDLGLIVLTELVETVTGERLDRYLRRRVFEPLEMRATRYNPPHSWVSRIAPTEVDTTWRDRLVRGEVHDENTAAMGGISGHAGLFSTAGDLVRFAQMMLGGGVRGEGRGARGDERGATGARFVKQETIAEFTRRQDPALSHRALGWETPNGENSAGSRLSPRAYGHTGFTGTSLWIDPEQDVFVILLTNRVHPTRENPRIFEVRRRVADLVVEIGSRP